MKLILNRSLGWLRHHDRWEKILAVAVLALAAGLMFYNLGLNPRPWQDEGLVAGIAKSLVQTGVYAIKTVDGYQTYGGVQSVGPTIVLPIALAYRLLGVGLVQGRLVMALFAFLTLVLFYLSGKALFNRRAAIVAVILVLGSQSVGYFIFGRPVFGEVPALGLFLAGWLVWNQAVRRKRIGLVLIAGLLFGLAMVTKSYYLIIISGTIAVLMVLDLVVYHQHRFQYLFVLGATAAACYALWTGWQRIYFGAEVFSQNLEKLRQLAVASMGFNPTWIGDAIKLMIGSGASYFYFFWGFLALLYAMLFAFRRTREAFLLAFVWLFTILWLAYSTVGRLPIPRYILPGTALTALFVGKLAYDLARGFAATSRDLWSALRRYASGQVELSPIAMVSLGTLVGLTSFALMVGYEFQRTIRTDVLDKTGNQSAVVLTPPQLAVPDQVVDYLNQNIGRDKVIETWEVELGIMTDHSYHFPDQSIMIDIDNALHHGGDQNYSLGAEYFNAVHPDYVVVGWFGRLYKAYDMDFLNKTAHIIASFGDGDWRYDVYQMNSP